MKIQVRDVLSFSGRDYVVEGCAIYRLAGRTAQLARAVDGEAVVWIEPPGDATTATAGAPIDRFLVLRQIRDLDLAVPPAESVSYRALIYVQRLAGRGALELEGAVPERTAGPVEVWRYRAAADRVLQIESTDDGVFMLAGESVHRGLIELLPGR